MIESFTVDAPLVHIIFIIVFALLVAISLLFFLMAVMQKSESWRKRAFSLLIAVGIFAAGVAITGIKAALEVDFSNPRTTNFMYIHIFSGTLTVVFSFYVAFFSFKQILNNSATDKKVIVIAVVLLGFVFLTLSLGKSVLETGAAQHKQEVLYGPPQ